MDKKLFSNAIEFPNTTHTAAQAAEQLKCDIGQIAKSIVFKSESGQPILVVASGKNQVDVALVEYELGEKVAKADADFVLEETGFAIGGVPPYKHKKEIKTFVDEDLFKFREIWSSAGTANSVFKTTAEEIMRNSQGNAMKVTTSSK